MRNVLLRAVAFLAGLVVVAAVLHLTLIAGLRRRETGPYGVWNRVVEGRIRTGVLISGSSRSLVGIDAVRLAEKTGLASYNISIDGSRLEAQRALLGVYLNHNPAPRLLLQSLDVFSLEPLGVVYQPEMYLPYLWEPEISSYVRSVDTTFWAMKHLPLYGFAVSKPALFNALYGLSGRDDARRETLRNGSRLVDSGWDGSFERYLQDHPAGTTYAATPAGVGNLEAIIALAQRRGVPLVLVYPPEHELSGKIARNRREMIALFADIARRHGVEFWDYSADAMCADKDFFFNSLHLNLRGARLFTDALAARVAQFLASR